MTKEEQAEIQQNLTNSVKALVVAAKSLESAAQKIVEVQKNLEKPNLTIVGDK